MKKRFAVFTLISFILTAWCGMAFAEASAQMTLNGPSKVAIGAEFEVELKIRLSGTQEKEENDQIKGVGVVINYDPSIITFQLVSKEATYDAKFLDAAQDIMSLPERGEVGLGYVRTSGGIGVLPATDVMFAKLKFRVNDNIGTDKKISVKILEDETATNITLKDDRELEPTLVQLPDITIVPIPTGTLKLDITPGNAKWKVVGETPEVWRTSADVYTVEIPTGDSVVKTVEFEPAAGYFTPANKNLTIKKGANTAPVSYVKKGSVKATLTPASAKWRLDPVDGASTWRASGYEYTNLEAGTYTVIYGDVAGYATPPAKTVSVSESAPTVKDNAWDASVNYAAWGTITINITPDAAAQKAEWYVDGKSGDKYPSGRKLPLQGGSHDVYFTEIDGYTTPKVLAISLKDGDNKVESVEYIEKSLLTVTLSPDTVAANGGKWILAGKEYASGEGVKVDAGTYSISFKAAAHFFTPPSRNVIVLAETPKNELVEYVEKGKITVNLTPAAGRWRLHTDDAGQWRASGASAADLDAATYTISYEPMDGYVTPADETVTISKTAKAGENTKVIPRSYAEHGTLTVTIAPDAVSGDARWYLTTDAAKQYPSGHTLSLAPGDYTIAFREVSGYTTPADISVTVPAAASVSKAGEYKKVETGTIKVTILPEAVSADAKWYVDDDTENGYLSGHVVTVAVGEHTVKFAKVNGYSTPADGKVTIAAGDAKELTATYTTGGGSGGGGGCSAGVAVLALLAAAPLVLRRKK